jgi:hypothetical protein
VAGFATAGEVDKAKMRRSEEAKKRKSEKAKKRGDDENLAIAADGCKILFRLVTAAAIVIS